jgi:hypothetical protein
MERLPTYVDEIDLARSDMHRGDAFHAVIRARTFVAVSARYVPVASLWLNSRKEINCQLATANALHG